MKKKIFAIACIMQFLLCSLPTCNSQEIVKDTALNTMPIAHVVIKGNGNVLPIVGSFVAGIGTCLAMIIKLESDGHVEINKLFDPSNTIELEGSRGVILIGFIGYNRNIGFHASDINLNGVALIAMW